MKQKIYKKVVLFPLIFVFILLSTKAYSATWYVDKGATGTNQGTSWSNAWTSLSSVSGASAGDTVYISGGSISKTYSVTFSPKGGTAGNPITYRVGQDAGHNGTVIIEGGNTRQFGITPLGSNITINGNVGGAKHIKIQNVTDTGIYSSSKSNLDFSYLIIDNAPNGITINYGTGYFISYCDITHIRGDHGITFGGTTGATWDTNLVHHNYIQVSSYQDSSGTGADGIRWTPGTSVYNNTIESYDGNAGTNHQDGVQSGGRYTKIYNNIIKNMGNAGIYHDQTGGSVPTDVYIYNNVVILDDGESGYQRAIAIQNEGSSSSAWNNVRTYNNTIIGTTFLGIRIQKGLSSSCSGCEIKNNLLRYGGGITVESGFTGVVESNNYEGNPGTVDLDANYAPTASDTQARDQGVDLSAYFSTDLLGTSRPQGSAWDIGAYEFTGEVPGKTPNYPMPTVN